METMSDHTKGSFIRWQGITLQQLSFVNNLIIGLSAGILAFQFDIAFSRGLIFDCTSKLLFSFSIGLISLSLVVGCVTALNRLTDFRTTAQVARKREKGDLKDIEKLREKAKCLGKWTWRLSKIQIVLFSLGAILIPPLVILHVVG